MPPQSEQLSVHLWLVMMKAYQAVRQHDERSIATSGLCPSDFGTLEVLLHKGPQPVNVIGEKILLTSGSITAAVDRLERKGLVERQASATDRRVRLVNLTVTGRTLIEGIFQQHQLALDRALSGLNTAEKQTLIDLLKKMGQEASRLLKTN